MRASARAERRPRRATPLLAALALAGAHATAHAGEPLRLKLAVQLAAAPARYEQLLADVVVNGQRRGEFTLLRDPSGDYYVRADDLASLGIAAAGSRSVRVEGVPHVSLRSLRPGELRFDERLLLLEVNLPTTALGKREYDLAPRRGARPLQPRETAGFANYRLSAAEDRQGAPLKLGLANELAFRTGDLLVRNEGTLVREGGSTRGRRFATQFVYDRREEQQRLIVGDHTATSGELGSTLAVGGLSFAKLYQMTPGYVRQPLAGYAGAVSTPSLVEVRMGGIPVFREQVAPGPFELRNLHQFGGARDVEVVVRDALGREQSVSFPYYFADQALRQGLHEYAYSAGALRHDPGGTNGEYRDRVASGMHRYGLNDRVTLGARGEFASSLWNLGGTALYRHDRLGAFSAGLSGSGSGGDGRRGAAASLGHSYQKARFGMQASARRFGEGYATAQDLLAPRQLRAEYGAGASYNQPAWGTLYFDRLVSERRAGSPLPGSAVSRVGYSYSFGARTSFFASFSRVREARAANEAFFGLLLSFDRVTSVHLSARRDANGDDTLGAQASRALPSGEGAGWRLGYSGARAEETRELTGYAQYNARAATISFDGASGRAAGFPTQRYEAAVAGAASFAGGRWGFSRPIEDSFIAVDLAAPIENVRVYRNNQEIGATDRDGRLILPQVGSFQESQISIEPRDVPLDYAIDRMQRVVSPPYRSGSLVRFDLRRLRAVEGLLRLRSRAGAVRPAEHAEVRLAAGGDFVTGRDGRFYLEDLAPGSHPAVLEFEGRECRFMLEVPESSAPIARLPEVTACD